MTTAEATQPETALNSMLNHALSGEMPITLASWPVGSAPAIIELVVADWRMFTPPLLAGVTVQAAGAGSLVTMVMTTGGDATFVQFAALTGTQQTLNGVSDSIPALPTCI
ncbi:MAG: hypothetical protein DWB44_15850 [Chloroflexi bacterium]|nr:hypothetical protein [Chloroflexota bacterium]